MKNKLQLLHLLQRAPLRLALIFSCLQLFSIAPRALAQSAGDFRSVASGNWSAANTWQIYSGSSWGTTLATPTTGHVTTLQSGFSVTNDISINVDEIVVQAGAFLTIATNTVFNVIDGAGIDLDVFGTVTNIGVITNASSGVAINIENGAQYVQNQDGGTVPKATWSSNSSCLIEGFLTTTFIGGLGQSFYNLSFYNPSNNARFDAQGTLTNVVGNLSITGVAELSNVGRNSPVPGHKFALTIVPNGTFHVGGELDLTNVQFMMAAGTTFQGTNVQVTFGGNINFNGIWTFLWTEYAGANRLPYGIITFTNNTVISLFNWNRQPDGQEEWIYEVAPGATLDMPAVSHSPHNQLNVWSFTNFPGSTLKIGAISGIEVEDDNGLLEPQDEEWESSVANATALWSTNWPQTNYFEPNATYVYECIGTGDTDLTGSGLPPTVANLIINDVGGVAVMSGSGDSPFPFNPALLIAVTNMLNVNGLFDLNFNTPVAVSGLSGSGSIINGDLTMPTSGLGLFPGTNGVAGTLTLGGALTLSSTTKSVFDLSGSTGSGNDQVVVGTTLAGNGATITINPLAPLATADYTLFTTGSGVTSGFNSTPAWVGTPPANKASYSILTSNGNVVLHYAFVAQPVFGTTTVSGGNLVLTGMGGSPTGTYKLITSTNVATALTNWTVVASGSFSGTGSFSNSIPITPSIPKQFYSIKTP
jgi:hypothetical protein